MSANQFAFIAESAWTEERYHRCPMDSDPAQLRIVGKFVSPAGRVGSIADDVAASRAVARTPCAAYPAYAESVVANERAVIAGIERRDGRDRAGDYPRHRGRGT